MTGLCWFRHRWGEPFATSPAQIVKICFRCFEIKTVWEWPAEGKRHDSGPGCAASTLTRRGLPTPVTRGLRPEQRPGPVHPAREAPRREG